MPPSRERRFIEAATSRAARPPPESFQHQSAPAGPREGLPHGRARPYGRRVSAWEKRAAARRCCGGTGFIWRARPALPCTARSLCWRIRWPSPSLACRRTTRSNSAAALEADCQWAGRFQQPVQFSTGMTTLIVASLQPWSAGASSGSGRGARMALLIGVACVRHDPTMLTACIVDAGTTATDRNRIGG